MAAPEKKISVPAEPEVLPPNYNVTTLFKLSEESPLDVFMESIVSHIPDELKKPGVLYQISIKAENAENLKKDREKR
jgi:hypothetical protein